MKTNAVVIAGGGPTGLMLAGELALAGVDVAIVERRVTQDLPGSRAGGLHARTIEVLDQRGLAERFVVQGKCMQVGYDVSDAPTRHNYVLALWQEPIERTLAAWVDELRVPILRGAVVTSVVQHDDAVDVVLSDGSTLEARYLVGCDGGRSVVRKQAGIEFAGWDASTTTLVAEVAMADEPAWGMRPDERGVHGLGKLERGRVRVVSTEAHVGHGEPTIDELRAALVSVWGTDFGVHDVTYLSRFSDATRQAVAYRRGRVLLAGDAAHVHSPVGGQGLNLGVQDAVNLGWKLAQVVHGHAPEASLDTYHAERHPVGARVLEGTMAATALHRGDVRSQRARAQMDELMTLDEPRRRYAARMSGLDIRYELGEGHPLLGRRMPDLDLDTDAGPTRVYAQMHEGKPLLLGLGDASVVDLSPWRERVKRVDARCTTPCVLPVLGEVPTPTAVLIRPDGHVVWVGDGTDLGLHDAATRWFGPPQSHGEG